MKVIEVTHQQTAVVLHNQITILDLNNLETAVDEQVYSTNPLNIKSSVIPYLWCS